MAGGEWRLGTASIYMGASYRSPPLRQAKSTQLHGYNSRPTKQIRQRYRPLNRAERGKLRLGQIGPAAAAAVPALILALGNVDAGIRDVAAKALGQIGPAGAESAP